MKKFLFIISIISLFTAQVVAQTSVCGQYHRKYCSYPTDKSEEWRYNAQSRSGLFKQGMISKMRCVIYKGMDYRISLCCETTLGVNPAYKIYDARTNELLYDSNNGPEDEREVFEFESASTRQIVIEVSVPVGDTDQQSHKPADAACVGLLILHKISPRSGF